MANAPQAYNDLRRRVESLSASLYTRSHDGVRSDDEQHLLRRLHRELTQLLDAHDVDVLLDDLRHAQLNAIHTPSPRTISQ